MNHYPTTFRTYILQGLEHILAQVSATKGLLAENLCQQAFHLLNYGFELDEAWSLVSELMLKMEPQITLSGIPDAWTQCLKQGLYRSELMNDNYMKGNLFLFSGYVHERSRNLMTAQEHYHKGVIHFELVNDPSAEARALNRLANIQRMKKDFDTAQITISRVFELAPIPIHNLILTYLVLGWLSFDKSDWTTSHMHFEIALRLSRETGDRKREAQILRDIGSILQMQKQFELAIKQNEQAITLFKELGSEYELAITEMNLGVVYIFLEQWEASIQWLEQAHTRFHFYKDTYYLGINYTNQGIVHRGLGHIKISIQFFQMSVDFLKDTGDVFLVENAIEELRITLLKSAN